MTLVAGGGVGIALHRAGGPLDALSASTRGYCFGAYSTSRKLRGDYIANLYATTGSGVSTLYDQSSVNNFTQGTDANRPAVAIAGPLNRMAMVFAASDFLVSSPMSSFWSTTSNYAIISCIFDAFDTTDGTHSNNDALFADQGGYAGLHVKRDPPSSGRILSYANDGVQRQAAYPTLLTTGVPYVVDWVHGANMEISVNGVNTIGEVCGAIASRTSNMRLGVNKGSQYLAGKIFELLFLDIVPSAGERAALQSNMRSWIGA